MLQTWYVYIYTVIHKSMWSLLPSNYGSLLTTGKKKKKKILVMTDEPICEREKKKKNWQYGILLMASKKNDNSSCVGQFCPVFQLCERKGPAQYSVWEETDIRGCPPEKWTKLPSEERWSTFVRNGAVSENDGHLGTSVRGAWRIC